MKKIYDSPIGHILIETNENAVTRLELTQLNLSDEIETPIMQTAHQALMAYFRGETYLSFKLEPKTTPFQLKVYEATQNIPIGKTATYSDISAMIGNPKAVRAVGQALNKNPIMIFIPCHRIIGKNGRLVGFNGGVELKQRLLEHEKHVQDRVFKE